MKFSDGRESVEMGGRPHPEGEFLFQIPQGGIDFRVAEDSKMQSIWVTSESVKVVEAEEGTEPGGKLVDFVVIITKKGETNEMGEQRIVDYLKNMGLTEKFIEKYGSGDIDMTDEKFIAGLKLKLPGQKFRGRVFHKKDQKGNDRANLGGIYPPTKPAQEGLKNTPESSESGGDDSKGSGSDDW